ncbi:Glucokinase [hydrothermal vent metagenome]|uniref:Glucokinase n=1 Tax=hydrothermal vent metagenome TaxID=652676 RepID=A0A3B0V180_9ZZZZ
MSNIKKGPSRSKQALAKTLVLAGDMGGTKTDLALFSFKEGSFSIRKKAQFKNKDFSSPAAVIEAFLERCGEVDIAAATIGVAARIDGGRASFTNLDWVVDERELAARFGTGKVSLVNDLVAASWGLPMLGEDMFYCLQKGRRGEGNAVMVAAGTGLGEVILNGRAGIFYPSASEGGHSDFAPSGLVQQGLLAYLYAKFGHVSVERVVSGPGLKNIYDFLMNGRRPNPTLADRFRMEDPSAVISEEAAKEDGFKVCKEALDIFISALGAEAGNLALKTLPAGGVYIAGGIPWKIIKALRQEEETFMNAFRNKGRFSDYLGDLPVYVVLEPKVALYGAANHAYSRLTARPLSF